MERGFLFRPSLRPSFRPRRRAATRPIIAENGAAAAGEVATVLGSASRFVGNSETGKDPTNPPSLRGTRGVSSKEIPGRLFVWRRSMHAAWIQKLRIFNKINATAVTVTFI